MSKINPYSLCEEVLALGARQAKLLGVNQVKFDPIFRTLCESNACGVYGACWMCPPDVGELSDLIDTLKTYEHVLVYQTVFPLEDSYDYESMLKARREHAALSRRLRQIWEEKGRNTSLHLSVGGCGVCETCTKPSGQPCRAPNLAMASLEAYGIHVASLAEAAGMRYHHGENTVTYFGAVFFSQ